ncbi:MAG: nucleotidyltransferase domain-containing protein [Kiritimatiellia bacterium]
MALSEHERQALSRFKSMLREALSDEEPEARLFGSKARGDDGADSDLDVLVTVSGDDWHICDKVYDITTDLLLETGICISAKTVSRNKFEEMCRGGSSFANNVVRDGVPI